MDALLSTGALPIQNTGYDIDNSLKLEYTDTEYLKRTVSSAGNTKIWCASFWIKRSQLDPASPTSFWQMLSSMTSDGAGGYSGWPTRIGFFYSADQLWLDSRAGSGNKRLTSIAKLRDTSAWYHIVVMQDTTQATDTNRSKIYINGELLVPDTLDYDQYPAQNDDTAMNVASSQICVGAQGDGTRPWSGYIADVHFLDGQSGKTASDFGEYDSASGIWIPKKYTGSYGTNGFYLKFEDSSNMGLDSSGNGNNLTSNNIAAANQATDTPTNNFCTLNPLIPYAVQNGSPVISEGATYHNGSGGWTGMKGTIGFNKGKWYWELQTNSGSGGDLIYGVQTVEIINSQSESTATSAHNLKETAAWYVSGGHWIADQTSNRDDVAASSVSHTIGNTVVYGIGLNMDDGEVTYYANGSAITNLTNIDLDGLAGETVAPFCSVYNQAVRWNLGGYTTISISSAASDANGYGTFEYAPPSGYYALCTKNLAEYG